MKAIILSDFGGPSQLRVEEVPPPVAGPHDVLVQVEAAGVCHHDLLHRAGKLAGAPKGVILGHEVAGRVVATGAAVSTLQVGDRITGYQRRFCGQCRDCLRGRQDLCRAVSLPAVDTEGAYAQYIRLPAVSAIRIPDNVSFQQAALASCPIGTAMRALISQAGLTAGETVLVNGASGGLGVHQIQIARALGAHVIAVTGDSAKASRLEELGASSVVVARDGNYSAEVWNKTGKKGVDVAMENLGSTLPQTLRATGMGGRIVVLGNIAPGSVEVSPGLLIGRRLRVQGSGSATLDEVSQSLAMIASGLVRPQIDRVMPFTQAAQAHALLEARQVNGRIILSGW